ncbi:hypothetical protein BC938DRAFT_475147 [Jimgerdemannia flammicorona]|uniref:Protein kinase domain-containing protein n=1 Tax=Jimgerdemannia flammicorona TaxID=994334 RepID=A0A433QRW1_9FUNG|nr:hypothetical protein BC938DRAFT_475147 [Jimgerdemannia flammicorona]
MLLRFLSCFSHSCIMLELFTRKPVFPGNDEITQLELIYRIMGTPTPETWPAVVDLPWYELVRPKEKFENRFRETYAENLSPGALELLEALLSLDPAKRPSASQALQFDYFTKEDPEACSPERLPKIKGDWHEYETKQRKRKNHPGPVNGFTQPILPLPADPSTALVQQSEPLTVPQSQQQPLQLPHVVPQPVPAAPSVSIVPPRHEGGRPVISMPSSPVEQTMQPPASKRMRIEEPANPTPPEEVKRDTISLSDHSSATERAPHRNDKESRSVYRDGKDFDTSYRSSNRSRGHRENHQSSASAYSTSSRHDRHADYHSTSSASSHHHVSSSSSRRNSQDRNRDRDRDRDRDRRDRDRDRDRERDSRDRRDRRDSRERSSSSRRGSQDRRGTPERKPSFDKGSPRMVSATSGSSRRNSQDAHVS